MVTTNQVIMIDLVGQSTNHTQRPLYELILSLMSLNTIPFSVEYFRSIFAPSFAKLRFWNLLFWLKLIPFCVVHLLMRIHLDLRTTINLAITCLRKLEGRLRTASHHQIEDMNDNAYS